MKINVLRRFLTVLTVAAFSATLGHASTLVYYVNIFDSAYNDFSSPVTSPLSLSALNTGATDGLGITTVPTGGASTTVSLPQFNQQAMYTLTSVQLVADWALSATLNAYNSDSTSARNLYGGYAYADMTISGAGLSASGIPQSANVTSTQSVPAASAATLTNDSTQLTAGSCTSAHPGALFVAAGVCVYYAAGTPGTYSNTGSLMTTGEVDGTLLTSGLGAFESNSPTNLSFSFNTPGVSYACTSDTQVTCGASGSGGGVVEIIYNYTDTPEPATMGLAGGALVGLVLVARRRRVKKA